ncbi:lipid II flippase MurJ [Pseudorhodoferax sp.]|uniref:lipid II flippase MurJ n=1 Tax=Pseudorhodoferax sp. TaxID=1993553 RepID=UPI002DD66082|nr:lipid II flippase MurJ [Pseudorhodoferax sp.]
MRGITWTALFVVLGKLVGAGKEMAVAWRYGVGEQVDAYLFIFNIVTWPVSVWFAVLPVVLVPLVARLRQAERGDELVQFRRELLGTTLVVALLLGLLGLAALRGLLDSSWSGLSPRARSMADAMAPAMASLMPLGLVVCLFSSWMLAAGRHATTLLECLPALAILLAVALWPQPSSGPLVVGTLAGFGLQLACVVAMLAVGGQIEWPRFTLRSAHWRTFRHSIGVMLAGQALMSAAVLLDQFFAAGLHAGAIATLSYANRILALVIGLGVTAVSRATLPVFAGANANNPQQLAHIASQWTRLLLAMGVLAIALGWWVAPAAVRLLFERGAFAPADTEAVATVLRHGLLQLPPYFAAIVLLSLLSARSRYRSLALVSAACLACKFAANLWLVPRFGLVGIQWSTAVMYTFYFAALAGLARYSAPRTSSAEA